MSDPIPSQSELRTDAFEAAGTETGLGNGAAVGRLRGFVEVVLLLVRRVFDLWVTPASRQVDRRIATGFWLRLHATNAGLTPLQASPYNRDEEVQAELRRLALKDPRVDARTVETSVEHDGTYELRFVALGSIDQVLRFDLQGLADV